MGLYYVKGRFRRIEGRIEMGPGAALRGRATIDARSITTRMPPRDWHLRTRDFLDVGRHPAIEIEVEGVERAGDAELTVPATFEIRGTSRPVELAGHLHRQSLHLHGTLDRRDFGVRARPPFEWIVGHEVRLDVVLALERA